MFRSIHHLPIIAAIAVLLGSMPLTVNASGGHSSPKCPTAVVHKLPKHAGDQSKVPVLSFGIQGGNIRPLMVSIAMDGTVTASYGTPATQKLSDPQNTLKGILALADAEGFFSMPASTRCSGVNPDVGARFITVYSSTTVKHVQVAGTCMSKFTQIYDVVQQLAGVNR